MKISSSQSQHLPSQAGSHAFLTSPQGPRAVSLWNLQSYEGFLPNASSPLFPFCMWALFSNTSKTLLRTTFRHRVITTTVRWACLSIICETHKSQEKNSGGPACSRGWDPLPITPFYSDLIWENVPFIIHIWFTLWLNVIAYSRLKRRDLKLCL